MKYTILGKDPLLSNSPVVVIPLPSAKIAEAMIATLDKVYSKKVRRSLAELGWSTQSTSPLTLSFPEPKCALGVRQIRLVPLDPKQAAPEQWRIIGNDIQRTFSPTTSVAVSLAHLEEAQQHQACCAITEGHLLASYTFTSYKSAAKKQLKKKTAAGSITFHLSQHSAALSKTLTRLVETDQAVRWARDQVNTPAQDLLPQDFLRHVKKFTATSGSGIKLTVHNRAALKRLGAGALLGVGQGSSAEPLLLHLRYQPKKKANSKRKPACVVLIGKGVTFDSGGLSLKTAVGMIDMKCDMAGASAVAGTFLALSKLPASQRPNVEIHGLIPLVENMVSGEAIRPGDVLRTISGKTIEVVNTDAEGRLILADALEYSERLAPTAIIDVATLTGACVSAIGEAYAGLFCEQPALASALLRASDETGELLWPLPFGDSYYRSLMDSHIADIKNSAGTHPGATLAALFLKEFVPKNVAWAHLDIAGPAFIGRDLGYRKRGATGFGVRLLLSYVQSL